MVNKGKTKGLSRSNSTQTDQPPHTDALFASVLTGIPADDWVRTWVVDRTIMLRRTSKRVKEQVDKMRLSAVVRFAPPSGTVNETTATNSSFSTTGQSDCLVGVRMCPVVVHLDLSCIDVGTLVARDVSREEVFVTYGGTLWKIGGAGAFAILERGLMQ